VQCGDNADWNFTVSISEWVKLSALSLLISAALTALLAGTIWLIAG
jgi:hypothetical protein